MAAYRQIPPRDYDEYRRFTQYGFAPEEGPVDSTQDGGFESDLFDLRGLYRDGLKSGCKRYAFESYVRDGIEQIGGLGAAATPPEYRSQGYFRELSREVCREYSEEGIDIVTLWPFSTPFYRTLGWATANDRYEFELPPTVLPRHDPRGDFQQLEGDDWDRLSTVEGVFGDGVTLSMRRSKTWWHERTLENWTGGTERFIYGYERGTDLAGYLIYTVEDETDRHERTLSISSFGYVDREAHRSLLEFLGRHGAQIDNLRLERSVTSRLLALVEDPGPVTCERLPGPMARLTSLDPLGELEWAGIDHPLTLAVEDPLLAENDGLFQVPGDGIEAVTDVEPDLSTDIGTLTQLYLGRYDPATAERVAGLTITTDSLRESLAETFPCREVCLREFF